MIKFETDMISKKSGKFERDRLDYQEGRELNWKKQTPEGTRNRWGKEIDKSNQAQRTSNQGTKTRVHTKNSYQDRIKAGGIKARKDMTREKHSRGSHGSETREQRTLSIQTPPRIPAIHGQASGMGSRNRSPLENRNVRRTDPKEHKKDTTAKEAKSVDLAPSEVLLGSTWNLPPRDDLPSSDLSFLENGAAGGFTPAAEKHLSSLPPRRTLRKREGREDGEEREEERISKKGRK